MGSADCQNLRGVPSAVPDVRRADALRVNLRVAYQVHRKSLSWTELLVVDLAGRAANRGFSRGSRAVPRWDTWPHVVEMPIRYCGYWINETIGIVMQHD